MPAEFPAYPGGRVTEAAGNDHGDCRMRVVTFTTADPAAAACSTIIAASPARAGYSAEQQARGGDQVLGGTKGRQRFLSDRDAGAGRLDVALIVNNGR